MRRKGRPAKQKEELTYVRKKRGRPRKDRSESEKDPKRSRHGLKTEYETLDPLSLDEDGNPIMPDDNYSEGVHISTLQVRALSAIVSCKDCGEEVIVGVRPTTKGMITEFTVKCTVCGSNKSTNTPNLIRERKRKREKKGIILQKTENINYAHVAAYLDNGLGYSGLRHYCRFLNARCLNEATFIVYARQVIADVVNETEDFLIQNARVVRKAFETQLDIDHLVDLTVSYTTTYHQWGSDFCIVAGAVIELQTGLVIDYDVANMYCHVCKINAKKIVSMSPTEMTEWFNKHQDTCEIREWCDDIDQDADDSSIKEVDPKYLEAFIAKKLWARSIDKFGFRYTTLIYGSDPRIHTELLKSAPYDDIPVLVDSGSNCFSRRKSEHARTAFQAKLKAKCPRERVQTKDRIIYVYSMSIPEYNKFAIGSNIKLRELVKRIDLEENSDDALASHVSGILPGHTAQQNEEIRNARSLGEEFVEEEEDEDNDDDDEEEDDEDNDEEEEMDANDEEEEDPGVQIDQIEVLEDDEAELDISAPSTSKMNNASASTDDPEIKTSAGDIVAKSDDSEILSIENPFENGHEDEEESKVSANEPKPFRVDFDED